MVIELRYFPGLKKVYICTYWSFYLKYMKLNRNSTPHGCSNHPTTIYCWMIWWSQKCRSCVQPILTDWIDWCVMDFCWESRPAILVTIYELNQHLRSWTWITFYFKRKTITKIIQFWYYWYWLEIWSIKDWKITWQNSKLEWWTFITVATVLSPCHN